jgi:hypothetical protein
MLSETDVHYISGFLYVMTRTVNQTVVLGEKVLDEASASHRDVDIVIATADDCGFIGVEVKDESRPLHVGIVEGLCQKFHDMPTIKRRGIVSSSGYTDPALRKALSHEVDCLTFVRGRLPPLATINLSHLSEMTISYLEWREGPYATLLPNLTLSPAQQAELSPDLAVTYVEPIPVNAATTLQQLVDRIVSHSTATWPGPPQQDGPIAVTIDVQITDAPEICLSSGSLVVTDARLTGIVEWETSIVPLTATCYLGRPDGQALAETIIVALRSGLLGLGVSANSQELRAFHIPNELRISRPTRQTIFPAS